VLIQVHNVQVQVFGIQEQVNVKHVILLVPSVQELRILIVIHHHATEQRGGIQLNVTHVILLVPCVQDLRILIVIHLHVKMERTGIQLNVIHVNLNVLSVQVPLTQIVLSVLKDG